MITAVGLYHEPKRKRPWLVCWWDPPDLQGGKQRKRSKSFKYRSEARSFQRVKQDEIEQGDGVRAVRDLTLGRLLKDFRKARLPGLGYDSCAAYEDLMQQMLDHFGAGRKLASIDQRRAEQFMASRRRRDGRPGALAPWTRHSFCRI